MCSLPVAGKVLVTVMKKGYAKGLRKGFSNGL